MWSRLCAFHVNRLQEVLLHKQHTVQSCLLFEGLKNIVDVHKLKPRFTKPFFTWISIALGKLYWNGSTPYNLFDCKRCLCREKKGMHNVLEMSLPNKFWCYYKLNSQDCVAFYPCWHPGYSHNIMQQSINLHWLLHVSLVVLLCLAGI